MVALIGTDYDGTWKAVYAAQAGARQIRAINRAEGISVVIDNYAHVKTATVLTLLAATQIDDAAGRNTALVYAASPLEAGLRITAASVTFNMGDRNDLVDLTGGYAGSATMNLGTGNDVGWGGGGNDVINGNAGLDNLAGGTGGDILNGGDDNDILRGGAGNDALNGDAGADRLRGGAGADTVNGGTGNDTILLAGSEFQTGESLDGGADVDTVKNAGTTPLILSGFGTGTYFNMEILDGSGLSIQGTSASETINLSGFATITALPFVDGLGGDDFITGNNQANELRGGTGNDTLSGNGGNDKLVGGDGLNPLDGLDTLNGGLGDDVLRGGLAADDVNGNEGNDTIQITGEEALVGGIMNGGADTDTIINVGAGDLVFSSLRPGIEYTAVEKLDGGGFAIVGSPGTNTLDLSGFTTISNLLYVEGDLGPDTITGNDQANELRGGTGGDSLTGNGGADTLLGGVDDDFLVGGAEGDFLIGGAGSDQLTGGSGGDRFVYAGGEIFGDDRISDFDFASGDRVNLDPAMTTTGLGTSTVTVSDASGTLGTILASNGHLWTAADFV